MINIFKKTSVISFTILIGVIFSTLLMPNLAHADKNYKGLVPPCNTEVDATGSFKNPCGINNLLELINNVINFLLFYISAPLAAILFAYSGFLLLTGGGESGKRSQAKSIFINVIIGFVVAMAAWLIIHTVLMALGYDGSWVGL